MKLSLRDWIALRPPAIFFGVSVIVAGLAIWYAEQTATGALRALELQNGKLNQAQQGYFAAVGEREAIVKYLPLYHRLLQQGVVGEEQRVEWIDELRDISRQYNLFGVNYEIDAQQVLNTPMGMSADILLLRRSAMRMELSVLHEVDLLTTLNAIGASRHAFFMMRDCEIKPMIGAEKNQFTPQLVANCVIDWLTIAEPRKSEVKP